MQQQIDVAAYPPISKGESARHPLPHQLVPGILPISTSPLSLFSPLAMWTHVGDCEAAEAEAELELVESRLTWEWFVPLDCVSLTQRRRRAVYKQGQEGEA